MKRDTQAAGDLGAAIDRLRAIADQSGHALLTERPVHPDHRLLDLCATALHHLAPAQKSMAARKDNHWVFKQGAERVAGCAEDQRLYQAYIDGEVRERFEGGRDIQVLAERVNAGLEAELARRGLA
jgi:hypothetical protein